MQNLSNETKSKIIENNYNIGKLLERNEELYLSELGDYDRRIYTVDQDDKIKFPQGYVRRKNDFVKLYNLTEITHYKNFTNIAYLMQYTDLTQYFFSRFKIHNQLKSVHFYYEVINMVSILEIVSKELAEKYREICSKCKIKKCKCNYIINSQTMDNLKNLISKLNDFQIVNISEEDLNVLHDMIDLRHNVHLTKMDETFYNNKKFSAKQHNIYIQSLKNYFQSINYNMIFCKNK